MRVLVYRNLEGGFAPAQLIDAGGPAAGPALLRPLIEQVLAGRRESFAMVGSGAAAKSFHAVPLPGLDNGLLGVLLIASARRDLVELENSLVQTGAMVAAAGILLGIRVSWWAAARGTRLVQAERVAAWRELARRLAHELKNPLFPLQITVENMLRARERYPEQFDEVFREGTATLLAELAQLKQIVGRFSDFAKMPAPEMQPVEFNAL